MNNGKRPNLVYVLADQLRYHSCGYAGDPKARTPCIDAFCLEGANFRNAVSGHPLCAPYRASLFTGKYTTSTGMVINELRMNPDHECLAHVLSRHGYRTAYIGKWHLWANQCGNHNDTKNAYIPPGPYRLGFDGFWAAYNFHHTYYRGYYFMDSPERIPIEEYEPDFQTQVAINQIRQMGASDRPFALFVSYGTPHDPWTRDNVPTEYLELFRKDDFALPASFSRENDQHADSWGRYKSDEERDAMPEQMRVYYAMAANLDHNFGQLLRAIDDAELRDNTIVVFTSDHGEMFGAHGWRGKNIFYDEAVRVPFLVRWPCRIPAGIISNACLNTPDIMPTLLSMMGLPIPVDVEGTDLSHCAYGSSGPEPDAALMMGTGSVAIWEDGHEWRALRTKTHTYAIFRIDGQELLFDNENDPAQLHNLAQERKHLRTLEQYRSMLKNRMAELGDEFAPSTWYRDNWTVDRIITFKRRHNVAV